MRGQGGLYRRKGTENWWLDYSVRGTRHMESSGTANRKAALDLLAKRVGDRKAGKLVGSPDRVTFAMLRELAERQYVLDGRRSLHRLQDAFNRLGEFFGVKDATGDHSERVIDLTPARLDAYAQQRLAAGRSRSCVNYELAAVRRAFRLAIEKGLLATMPVIKLPKVRDARSGFFEDG